MSIRKIKNKWQVKCRTPSGKQVKRLFPDRWKALDFEGLITKEGLASGVANEKVFGYERGKLIYRDFVTKIWLPAAKIGATSSSRTRKPQCDSTNYHMGKRMVCVLELIGDIPLVDLNTVHYEKIFKMLEESPLNRRYPGRKLAASTANKILKHMNESMKFAAFKKLIPFNTWAEGARFYCPPTVKLHWKPEECARFLKAAKAENLDHYTVVLTALRTAMRRGEIFGLELGDLDFGKRNITVERQFDEHRYNTEGIVSTKPGLKNGVPFKVIPMAADLADVLREYVRGKIGKKTKVFDFPPGEIKNPTEIIERYIVAADVPRICFRNCRDTFITNMSVVGAPESTIAKIAGCSKSNLSNYQRLNIDDTRNVIDAVKFDH